MNGEEKKKKRFGLTNRHSDTHDVSQRDEEVVDESVSPQRAYDRNSSRPAIDLNGPEDRQAENDRVDCERCCPAASIEQVSSRDRMGARGSRERVDNTSS